MKNAVVFIQLFAVLLIAPLAAQNPATPAPDKPTKIWLSGGVTLNSGNTQSTLINACLRGNYKKRALEVQTGFDGLYGVSDKQQIANRGKWTNNLALKMNSRHSFLGLLNIEYDRLAHIDLRTTFGLGTQLLLHEETSGRSRLSASLNGEVLNYSQSLSDKRSLRLDIQFSNEKQFSKNGKFFFSAFFTPNLDKLSEDYRLELLSTLSLLMKSPFWLTLKLQDRFNNYILTQNIKKNDLTFITSLEVAI